jgi:hypothetical protein
VPAIVLSSDAMRHLFVCRGARHRAGIELQRRDHVVDHSRWRKRDQLRRLARCTTPEGTETHIPVPHHEIVELMRYTLGFYGHEILEEHHALTPDGARYFGLLSLRSPYGGYGVGYRRALSRCEPRGSRDLRQLATPMCTPAQWMESFGSRSRIDRSK